MVNLKKFLVVGCIVMSTVGVGSSFGSKFQKPALKPVTNQRVSPSHERPANPAQANLQHEREHKVGQYNNAKENANVGGMGSSPNSKNMEHRAIQDQMRKDQNVQKLQNTGQAVPAVGGGN